MDNHLQIREYLRYESLGDFYFIQLFKRKKDNPSMDKHEKLIKSYSVFSLEEYNKVIGDIMYQCDLHNARAYIRLNKRNSRNVALHMIKHLSESILCGQTNSLFSCYDSIVGQFNNDSHKTWLVDIDGDYILAQQVMGFILDEVETRAYRNILVPTINGYHYITSGFDTRKFKEQFPTIEIHKDNPTLLYYEPVLTIIKEGREEAI